MKALFTAVLLVPLISGPGIAANPPIPTVEEWNHQYGFLNENAPKDEAARKQLAARIHEALNDPAFLAKRNAYGKLSAIRAIELLGEVAPADAVKFLPLTKHKDPELAKAAIKALAGSLDPAAAEILGEAIRKQRDGSGGDVIQEMEEQISYHKRAPSAAFVKAIWPHLEADVMRGDLIATSSKLMCRLDRDHAREFLCSKKVLSLASPALRSALESLCKRNVDVPTERLIPLIDACLAKSQTPEVEFAVFYYGLPILAEKRDPKAKEWIDMILADGLPEALPKDANKARKEANSRKARRFKGATRALMRYEGIVGEVVDMTFTRSEYNRLTPPQKHVAAAMEYDYATGGGGHQKLYDSGATEYLDQIAPALEAVGAKGQLEIFLQSNAVWGDVNPVQNLQKFLVNTPKPTQLQKRQLDELDMRLYHLDSTQSLISLLEIYAAKHAEHFKHLKRWER